MNLGINTITAIGQQPAKILKSPHIESLCRRILVDGLKVARAEQIDFEDHIVDDILNIYKRLSRRNGNKYVLRCH